MQSAQDEGRSRILLLLDASGDRRVVAAWLAESHDVFEAYSDDALGREFDLCIIDDAAYTRLWEQVSLRKRESEPLFLPFVLLSSEHAAPLIAQLPTHDIDETLEAPIAREVLTSRVRVLLERRRRERRLYDARRQAMEDLRAAQDALKQELETTKLLLGAADALAFRPALDDVLDSLTKVVLDSTDHARVSVILWDEKVQCCIVAASRGESPLPAGTTIDPGALDADVRHVIEERRSKPLQCKAIDSGAGGTAAMRMAKSGLQIPLFHGEQWVGILAVDDPSGQRVYAPREIEIVEGVASQASLAIENARLLEAERERARFGASMADISTTLSSSLDVDATLSEVLMKVRDQLDGWMVVAADRGSGGWTVRRVIAREGSTLDNGHTVTFDDSPAVVHVSMTCAPYIAEDVLADGISKKSTARRVGYRAFAMYPLVVRGEVTGLLTVFFSEPRKLTDVERDYLGRVAFAISVTEENSRLYKTEHDISDRLQSALLALPDAVRGVEFAHAYHSATEAARVGGDFYDLFELSHDHVGLVIGDVAGKGIDAAVLTSLVKNTIRAHAAERGKTPKRILELTNGVVYGATTREAFVTIFFGILDCRDGRLTYGNAGHTTAAILRTDGEVGQLVVTGPLLGAFEGVEYDQAEAVLDLDELLLLYTDGLTEARRDDELYGEQRLFELLSQTRPESPTETVEEIIGDIMTFTGNQLRDDLAVLAVKRVELDSVAQQGKFPL